MPCLHLINKVIENNQLQQIENCFGDNDVLLLIEDAVYLLRIPNTHALIQNAKVLKPDALARGITPTVKENTLNSHDEMVDLTLAFDKVLTWSF